MKEPISIKEILAVVIKRGRTILCATIIFAIIAAGVQAVRQINAMRAPENSAENLEEAYQEEYDAYEEERTRLEKLIKDTEQKRAMQQEYADQSLLMQIDPYNKWESNIVVTITNVSEDAFQQIFQREGTPVDYIISKIRSQYSIYWDNLMLMDGLRNIPYEDVEEKYLREIVDMKKTDGGTLTITAYADSEENAESLRDAVYRCIMDVKGIISEATYMHDLVEISRSTKVVIDQNLENTQEECLEKVKTYNEEYEEYGQMLDDLEEPERTNAYNMTSILKSALKWGILGAVVGFLLACAIVWLLYILRDGVETSRQAEAILGVPFLGSTAITRTIWVRMANRFVGERTWNSSELAEIYVAENVGNHLEAKSKILVASTLKNVEGDAAVSAVMRALKNAGYDVAFADAAEENPEILKRLRDCKNVLLVERLGISTRQPMMATLEIVKHMNAEVLGFVLI